MAYNKQSFREDLDWWREKTAKYNELDPLSDQEFRRVAIGAFRFFIESLDFIMESSDRKDGDDKGQRCEM